MLGNRNLKKRAIAISDIIQRHQTTTFSGIDIRIRKSPNNNYIEMIFGWKGVQKVEEAIPFADEEMKTKKAGQYPGQVLNPKPIRFIKKSPVSPHERFHALHEK